jgi:hypothetical protein
MWLKSSLRQKRRKPPQYPTQFVGAFCTPIYAVWIAASHVDFFMCSLVLFLPKCYLIISHDLSYTQSSESGKDHGLLPVEYTANARPCSRTGGSTRARRVTNYSKPFAPFCAIFSDSLRFNARNIFQYKIRGLFSYNFCLKSFWLRQMFPKLHWRWEQKTCGSLHKKCRLLISILRKMWKYLQVSINYQIQNFMKMGLAVLHFIRSDSQTANVLRLKTRVCWIS